MTTNQRRIFESYITLYNAIIDYTASLEGIRKKEKNLEIEKLIDHLFSELLKKINRKEV